LSEADCSTGLLLPETLSLFSAVPYFSVSYVPHGVRAALQRFSTGLIVGPIVIRRLRDFQIGQYIREEGPQAHQKKAGTPTMGGL